MKKFFGFGSSTPPPPAPPSKPPAAPGHRPSPGSPAPKPAAPASIVGRWKEPKGSDTTEFHADGAVTENPAGGEKIRGRYSLDGTTLKIRLEGMSEDLSFSATVKGDSLEMTDPDGETTRYQRIS